MLKLRVNQWLNGMRKYFFTYRDGYFDLPYLSNSPEIMIESLKHMPFTKFLAAENEIHTNNIFSEGVMRYRELEEGLWIMITEIEFRKNVSMHALYDQEPCDYYFLAHFTYSSVANRIRFNDLTIPTHGWGFYKPGTEVKSFFSKDDKGTFTNFVFNEKWFERNLPMATLAKEDNFKHFFESGNSYKTWDNLVPGSDLLIKNILDLLKDGRQDQQGIILVKMLCLQIISQFFASISTQNLAPKIKVSKDDSRMVARTEKILIDRLTSGFPGINSLAETLHTSAAKLQNLFKAVNDNSIFQYYQEKQMVLALQMLRSKPVSVKEIALTFGYQSPGKFSAAFKKYHGFSPSTIK
ncbi:helix-turn-helix transcriptional regulator [Mucilaginibacter sp. HD30]